MLVIWLVDGYTYMMIEELLYYNSKFICVLCINMKDSFGWNVLYLFANCSRFCTIFCALLWLSISKISKVMCMVVLCLIILVRKNKPYRIIKLDNFCYNFKLGMYNKFLGNLDDFWPMIMLCKVLIFDRILIYCWAISCAIYN